MTPFLSKETTTVANLHASVKHLHLVAAVTACESLQARQLQPSRKSLHHVRDSMRITQQTSPLPLLLYFKAPKHSNIVLLGQIPPTHDHPLRTDANCTQATVSISRTKTQHPLSIASHCETTVTETQNKIMGHSNVWNSHSKNHGPGSHAWSVEKLTHNVVGSFCVR
ncbi:hypothetical protein I3842_13G070800 [Carya illinoinensis]|uniref:Uncharacterized protein n=1 Tax=Carya illinoinensis TaxID=32201 RepID=A0A922AG14_CARIL|nr:hypothetical protein I3842_13G070800 [Carya illinoinensis]